jgi:twitching motility protein PilT
VAKLDELFDRMVEAGASDLHLVAGECPVLRVHGSLERMNLQPLDDDVLRAMLYEIAPAQKIKQFEETGDIDFGYEVGGLARFRANYFASKDGCGAAFRLIPRTIQTADELGLPASVKKAAMLHKGLVLVTGPTGSGKSTTLAAIIDEANRTRHDRIITIEDPIEFVHKNQSCLVTHREVGTHTRSFASALRGALREDPDIMLVGEMRDLETIRLALEAANTGHLVFGTLHTTSAAKTVDRIIEVFPAEEQGQIRNGLSTGLKMVVAQSLFRRIDKPGRCAALEILIGTTAVSNIIREGKTVQISTALQTGKAAGMQTLDDAIHDLLVKKWISPEEAHDKATDPGRFKLPGGEPAPN